MGRPVNKSKFGEVDSDSGNITVNCKVSSNAASVQGMIKSQRSSTKFNVDDAKDDSGNEGVCSLVDKASEQLAADEMSISAVINGTTTYKNIKKLFNRTCTDYDNVRYTWSISDDSAVNVMTIVAI